MLQPSDNGLPDQRQLSQPNSSTSIQDPLEPHHHHDPQSHLQGLDSPLRVRSGDTHCISCGQKREHETLRIIDDLDAIELSLTNQDCDCEKLGATAILLSPNDTLWDPQARMECQWELHTSKSNLELSGKGKCNCHILTLDKKPEKGDLRKHHSAECDRWSIEDLSSPKHELRKHASDDTRMARETRWSLQVPEVLPNPTPRCTCSKSQIHGAARESQQYKQELFASKSLEKPMSLLTDPRAELEERTSVSTRCIHKGRSQDDSRTIRFSIDTESKHLDPELSRDKINRKSSLSQSSSTKQKLLSLESKNLYESHYFLPIQRNFKCFKNQDESRNMKDEYSSCKISSLEPNPRLKLDERKMNITNVSAKWTPQGHSPLPKIVIQKRKPKKLGEIKWIPFDKSPSDAGDKYPEELTEGDLPSFYEVKLPDLPGVVSSREEDEKFRWKMLNQISTFPIYQGAWKDESSVEFSTPIWSPLDSETLLNRTVLTSSSPEKTSTLKSIRKRGLSFHSEKKQIDEKKPVLRTSNENSRSYQRPQFVRSQQASLVVPVNLSITKRSLSEDVAQSHSGQSNRAPNRAKSEEVPDYGDPWFAFENEVRQYVTTV